MQPPPQSPHGAPAQSVLASLHAQLPTTPRRTSVSRTCNQTPLQRAAYLVWFLRLRSARPVPRERQVTTTRPALLRESRSALKRAQKTGPHGRGVTRNGVTSHSDKQLQLRFRYFVTGAHHAHRNRHRRHLLNDR